MIALSPQLPTELAILENNHSHNVIFSAHTRVTAENESASTQLGASVRNEIIEPAITSSKLLSSQF